LAAKEALAATAAARLPEIEEQIKACKIVAPKDGWVVYYVPEQARKRFEHAIVAQGEPVREGQKLLQIPDLTRMVVNTRVPEGLVHHLHNAKPGDQANWQRATIQVDAFPGKILQGHVQSVDTRPANQDFFASDVKVYKTLIQLDEVP